MSSRGTASRRPAITPGRHAAAQYAVLEASPNAVVAVDVRGRITYANSQVEVAFGYAREDVLGQPVEMLLPGGLGTEHVAHREDFVANPGSRSMGIGLELSGRRRDGSEFPVEVSLSPVRARDGLEVFATVSDITVRKAAAVALAGSERFRAVLEASPNAVVAADSLGTITYVNPQVEAMFGYARDEALGQPVGLLLPARVGARGTATDPDPVVNPFLLPNGADLDLVGRRKDGTEFPLEISLSPVETADGRQTFATLVDITARTAAAAALLQSQKLESIGRLAGGIAHDFNNMLFAIRGYAEMLVKDMAPAKRAVLDLDRAIENVLAIDEAAQRATMLTAQLLAFSRQQVITSQVLDINAAIRGIEPMVRQLIGSNLRLAIDLDHDAGHIVADAGKLDQVLVNLVVNARDAMPDGGTMTIETSNIQLDGRHATDQLDAPPGAYVRLAVTDTGIGMDRETQAHVFEPFFTTKPLGKGTGLGLATIYGIVGQAGGHIALVSEPGVGTSFRIYFPRVEGAVGAEPPIAAVPETGAGTVLLVEDEPAVRRMTTELLKRSGYEVVAVADAREAMATIAGSDAPFDVLITDVVMPNTSGVELADWLMDRDPDVGVVLLSGYTPETLDLESVTARGATFVAKPVTSVPLLVAVQEAPAMRQANPLRRNRSPLDLRRP